MSFLSLPLLALDSVCRHGFRSFSTSLGIAVAVACVIVMVAVGTGARREVESGIAGLGSNVIHVYPGSNSVRGLSEGLGTRPSFTEADLQAIKEQIPDVSAGSGSLTIGARVVLGSGNWLTTVEGVHGDFLAVRDWPVERGRAFSADEERAGQRVALLGATVADRLGAEQDMTGRTVRIGNAPFLVVGVLAGKGLSSTGRDLDDVVLVPVKAGRTSFIRRNKLQPNDVGNLVLKAREGASTGKVTARIEDLLRERRRIRSSAEDDFMVRDLTAFLRTKAAAQETLGKLLALTALLALGVGGIGIMNVMLASVAERTREIGLRLAVGATRADIVRQLLAEAVILSLTGCLAGIALGEIGTIAVNEVVDWSISTSGEIMLLATAAAVVTGLAFGAYPAYRASLMSPLQALQRE